jgi:hypothetical protein
MNNKVTAEEGKSRIVASLTQGGFLPRGLIRVRYLPIGRHKLLYDITVSVADPGSGKTRMLKVQVLYNTAERELQVV